MTVEEKNERREAVRVKGHAMVDKVKELIHEGNVRRIVIKNDKGDTIMEIPVTAGVVAAIVAPVLAAIGAIAALANEWHIEVEHREPPAGEIDEPAAVSPNGKVVSKETVEQS